MLIPNIPWILIIIGLITVVLDIHVIAFLTPIGIALVSWGILLLLNAPIEIIALVILTEIIGGYYEYLRFAQSIRAKSSFIPEQQLIGKLAKVIDVKCEKKDKYLIVEVDFEKWIARMPDNYDICQFKKGDKMTVVKVEGVKLIVIPFEEKK